MTSFISRELMLLLADWAEQVGQDYEISSDELLSDLEPVLSPAAHTMLVEIMDPWPKPQPREPELGE
ncbi:MAG: hypothetical protein L0G87_00345 [Renibacterium salmoninarum]|nr:hypothetical protein [Renibacterium salmoninarum]